MRVNFTDIAPQHTTGYAYVATNESPAALAAFIDKVKPKRMGCIASGGEQPLIAVSRVDEVVAIDHSYESLQWAFFKAYLLETYGGSEAKRRLLNLTTTDLDLDRVAANATLPVKLQMRLFLSEYCLNEVKNVWKQLLEDDLNAATQRLEKLSFVHCDLRDREDEFDLLYTSNAHGHDGSRTGDYPSLNQVASKCVKHDGHLLFCTSNANPLPPGKWETVEVQTFPHYSCGWGTIDWEYHLIKPNLVPKTAPVTAAAK